MKFPKKPNVEYFDGLVYFDYDVSDEAWYEVYALENGLPGLKEFKDDLFWEF